MRVAVQRVGARRDFVIHFAYLAENSGIDRAQRFRRAVEDSLADLAARPGIGSPGKILAARYAGVRLWRVSGFEDYLIAYRPNRNGIVVERLIHAKQDYGRILK